jgi:competence protein ComEC
VLHKEIPFLRIGLPLCSGIISGLYFKPDIVFLVLLVIFIITGFCISLFFNKYQTNIVFGFSLTISLFLCGLILYSNEKDSLSILEPEKSLFVCTLSDYPAEKEKSFMLTAKIDRKLIPGGHKDVKGSIILYNKKDSLLTSLLPGDQLIIKCTPVRITNRGNPDEFDYRFYMENQGIKYYAFTTGGDIIRHIVPAHRKLIHRALIIREKIIVMYRNRGIRGERLALVAAITLGQKNMLDQEQKQNFIKAGVMHIMAVSGLHAIILSLFVFTMLFFLKRRFNILRVLITIMILWAFAFVTGLTPSVLRATLMFTFLQAGNLIKRPVNGINSVLASAFVLILIRPSVIFDAGFLLSYSAVIYIIAFYQDLYSKLQFKNWLIDKVWQSVVVTIVAQAGTLPLTIMLFNRFPTYFILTNIIIVPISNLLIIIGCLVPMLYPLHYISQYLALLLSYLTGLTELLTDKAASLPFSTLENIGMPTIECIFLTLSIFAFVHFMLKKRNISILYPIVFCILLVVADTVKEIFIRRSNELIVYNTIGSSSIGIKTGKILNLYCDSTLAAPEVLRQCATQGLKLKIITIKNNFYCIRAGKKKIILSRTVDESIIQHFMPDIVVLTGSKPKIPKNFSFNKSPEALIVSSEAASGFRLPKHINFAEIDTVHFVRKSGAFIKRI